MLEIKRRKSEQNGDSLSIFSYLDSSFWRRVLCFVRVLDQSGNFTAIRALGKSEGRRSKANGGEGDVKI